MQALMKEIRFSESEIKQVLTIVDELALSLDNIGSMSDSLSSAKDSLWEYMSTLQAAQRVSFLRGLLSGIIAREFGEDAYLAEREKVVAWPQIGSPEGTELENPWWGQENVFHLVGDELGELDWPVDVDDNIPQKVILELKAIPAYFHNVYSTLDSPYLISSQGDSAGGLVAFAKSNGRICVDITTGEIVKASQYIKEHYTPVNSSIKAFAKCVKVYAALYPFYSNNSSYATRYALDDQIHRELVAIDSVIDDYPAEAFWNTVSDCFMNGDFATENLQLM